MEKNTKFILLAVLFLSFRLRVSGQKAEFHGEAVTWISFDYVDGFAVQPGIRYIPQVLFDIPLKNKLAIDGELSADSYVNYAFLPDTDNIFDSGAAFYRSWIRLAGDRFEIRAGLQKINFGSASMLRPLMWFDRIDPRDPLKITKGVIGLQGKYYFQNNANIWLWFLYGNKGTKGWEIVPSETGRPEVGGRIQLPVPKGEIALTYHNRRGEFPGDWEPSEYAGVTFPENRFGLDFKLDLGPGLWFEASVIHQKQSAIPPFTKAVTAGADYTIGIGNGLTLTAEHMLYSSSGNLFSKGNGLSFTGLSARLPVTIITSLSTIVFYDWKNNEFYRFANCSFTFDNYAVNLIGFWNPDSFSIFNYGTGPNLFSGPGGQVMLVYNY